jgi:type VI secretion system protein ImpG
LTKVLKIVVVANNQRIPLPLACLKPVGFNEAENLLPYSTIGLTGYQLLTEYFAYPEKFFYFDIEGLLDYLPEAVSTIDVVFTFSHNFTELVNKLDDNSLLLHCTPIINLFKQTAEPITFDHSQEEYQIIADAERNVDEIEVYRIEHLSLSSSIYHDVIDVAPYFGRNVHQNKSSYIYWHSKRRPCWQLGNEAIPGDEVFLNFSDFNLQAISEELILTAEVLCSNRDMPTKIIFNSGKPKWQFYHTKHELIKDMHCVKAITTPKYREQVNQRQKLVQHAYLHQIGLVHNDLTLSNLKLLLSEYCFIEPESLRIITESIISATCVAKTIRHPSKLEQGFCRGMHYTLTFDEAITWDNDLYLFGSILHQVFKQFCAINMFVSLEIISKQRGVLFEWQPLIGTKANI